MTYSSQRLSVVDWSLQRGFNPTLVYAVIGGERKCLRGQSFRIAVALGLKPAPAPDNPFPDS
jgi:gp16 family phage-associated protein